MDIHVTGFAKPEDIAVSEEGLRFDIASPAPLSSLGVNLVRDTYGIGSFTEQIDFDSLAMDSTGVDSVSGISLRRFLIRGNDSSRIQIQVIDTDDIEDTNKWQARLTMPYGQDGFTTFVSKGTDIRLGIEYDHERLITRGFYDNNTKDNIGPVYLDFNGGKLTRPMSFEGWSRGRIEATGVSQTTGWLSKWQIIPWTNVAGDFDSNNLLELADIERIYAGIRGDLDDERLDLNLDESIDSRDLDFWIHAIKRSYFGDANLDGKFDSQDLISVFQSGKFESSAGRATWGDGDWNGDGQFSTSDLVIAFQDGGYEAGPKPAVVPEPAGLFGLVFWLVSVTVTNLRTHRRRWVGSIS